MSGREDDGAHDTVAHSASKFVVRQLDGERGSDSGGHARQDRHGHGWTVRKRDEHDVVASDPKVAHRLRQPVDLRPETAVVERLPVRANERWRIGRLTCPASQGVDNGGGLGFGSVAE
jgi:hypothetical protein